MNKTIKCMLEETKYKSKPQGSEVGKIQNNMKSIEITIEELANKLVAGCSFRPAFLMGRKEKDWVSQQIFALDFDKNTTIEKELNRCKKLNVLPCFGYTSFSHTEEHNKFRLVFVIESSINDYDVAKQIQLTLMNLFNNCDSQCSNLSRLYYGGKSIVFNEYTNILNYKELLTKYNNFSILEKSDYNKKYNTSYYSRKNPTEFLSNTNLNIEAIKDYNIQYLQNVLNINKEVILQNEQEFYDYIKTEIDLPELLGIDNPSKFNCIVHDDTNPSAGIIIGDSGDYMYNCFGCGFKGNIIHVIQALTKMKTYQVIEYIKEIYKIRILKTAWQQEQINILETNKQMLISGDFEKYYPEVYKLVRRYIPQLLTMHDIAIMNVRNENYTDDNGDIVFFISNNELTNILDSKSNKRINQRNVLFAFLKLLNKLDKDEIPEEDLKKALEVQKKYNHYKIVNYFSLGDYDIFKMHDSEKRASMWNRNNMSMTGLSYEGIYRTFGYDIACEIYPQYKNKYIKTNDGYKEINRTTTKASDNRTNEIVVIIMNKINENGYVIEKEIINELENKYGKTLTQVQIKRSLQEILDGYNLQRIRCNKQIKEEYRITAKGYPFIIAKNQN